MADPTRRPAEAPAHGVTVKPRKRAAAPVDVSTLAAWSHVETMPPTAIKVTAREEVARGRRLYLWWREGGNWKKQALGEQRIHGRLLRDERGEIDPEIQRWAVQQAKRKALALAGDPSAITMPSDAVGAEQAAMPLTLGKTKAMLIDAESGPYPHDTDYRRELLRALDYALTVWGADTPWAAIDDDAFTRLGRRRLAELMADGKVGVRGTQITVQRLLTIAAVLRKKRKIPLTAGIAPDDWRAAIVADWKGAKKTQRDPVPSRPRHTIEEMRKILAAAAEVDPRMDLLLALGAELRLGQVRRARRSDLDVEAKTFTVVGSGHKRGTVVDLTPGQVATVQRALGGFLAPLEAEFLAKGTDYFLFPGGKLRRWRVKGDAPEFGKGEGWQAPVSRNWVIKMFHRVAKAAGVRKVRGLAAYGIRRVSTDGALAEKISESGLQELGGWTNSKMPHDVYRENQNRAGRAEARDVKAKVRGEVVPESGDSTE